MGNPDHLSKLREGPDAWNDWRAENPGVAPDLRNVVLSVGEPLLGHGNGGAFDLRDALLNRANLEGAVLTGANLGNADLRGANLSRALLGSSDLSFANLSNAIFDNADLDNTRLTGAFLEGARLHFAANLTQAQIEDAHGDEATSLPAYLSIPDAWRRVFLAFADSDEEDEDDQLPADPYMLFGLSRRAKPEDIRAAYLRLAKKYHPDLNPGDVEAERRFKRITEGYRLLIALEHRRSQHRKRRATPSWAAAMGLFAAALAVPSLGLYWFDMPPFADRERVSQKAANGSQSAPENIAAFVEPDDRAERKARLIGMPLTERESRAEREGWSFRGDKAEPASNQQALDNVESTGHDEVAAASHDTELAGEASPAQEHPPAGMVAEAPTADEPPERLAALQNPVPAPVDAASPWEDEWRLLRNSTELLALHGFILRHAEKPLVDEARIRFRTLVAAVENPEELKGFIKQVPQDSAEKAVVNRRLAMLVEKATADADENAWVSTKDAGTVAAFRAYLLGYPNGRYVDEAEEKLAALEEQISGRKKEATAWTKARRTGTRMAYQSYIQAFPNGRFIDDAKRKLASLNTQEDAQRKEDEAWLKARRDNSRNAYFAYLNAYPNGRYTGQAQRMIENATSPQTTESTSPTADEQPIQRQSRRLRWPSSDEPFVDRVPGPY